MFTQKTLLLLSLVLLVSGQQTSRCSFLTSGDGDYTCRLDNMNVATENDFVNLDGTHKPDRTDANVTSMIFFHGRMTTAFPDMIFDRFPNVHTAFVTGNLNLNRFAILRCERLRLLSFEGPANAITRLFNGMFRGCVNLQEYRMQRTIVREIDENIFADTPNLRRLLIARNQIVSLAPGTFRGLNHLEHLDIERNQIVTFNPTIFQGLKSLRHIQCGQLNNRIWPSGIFNNLPSLEEINVNFSGLQTIEPNAFGVLPSLQVVRIYGEVRRLNANIFSAQLPRLRTLNLNRNRLDAVQRGFFDNLPALQSIYAEFNNCINQNFLNIVSMQPVVEAFETCFANY